MRNEKEVIQMQTRREFLKKSAALLGSAAVVGSVPGLLKAQAEDGQEVPAYPYPYVELDPAYVEKLAYEGYFENGCCFGVAKAILVALREKVGYPYTVIPEEMFANGKEGYTCGTLCGALGGAVAMIGLVCASADSPSSPRICSRGTAPPICRFTSLKRLHPCRRWRPASTALTPSPSS